MANLEVKAIQQHIKIPNVTAIVGEYFDHDSPRRRLEDLMAYVEKERKSLEARYSPKEERVTNHWLSEWKLRRTIDSPRAKEFEKFCHRINNPFRVATFLSTLYCRAFNKAQPRKMVERKSKKECAVYTCSCEKKIYFRDPLPKVERWSRGEYVMVEPRAYCETCREEANDKWYKNPHLYPVGSEQPINMTFKIDLPLPTRAFRSLMKYNEGELLQAAHRIRTLLK